VILLRSIVRNSYAKSKSGTPNNQVILGTPGTGRTPATRRSRPWAPLRKLDSGIALNYDTRGSETADE